MKSFLVLGLGRFGRSVATTLASLGHEVLGVDGDERIVQDVSRHLTEALQADITSEDFLKSLDIPHFDAVIVAVGDSMQVSIMATVLLRELNARRIIAKAQDDFQEKVLLKLGADMVVLPERDLGVKTAHGLVAETLLDTVELSADHSIASVATPEPWIGKTLGELALRTRHGLNLIAVRDQNGKLLFPTASTMLHAGEILTVMGENSSLRRIGSLRR